MKFLLDTHTFLWFVLNQRELSPAARDLIINSNHDIFLSPATYWEIAIKISIGKYQLPGPYEAWMNKRSLRIFRLSVPMEFLIHILSIEFGRAIELGMLN